MTFILEKIKTALLQEQDRWNLWLPILFGAGIAFYFELPIEPPLYIGFCVCFACALTLFFCRHKVVCRHVFIGLLFLSAGFCFIQSRAHFVKAPKIAYNMHSLWVQGIVDKVELMDNAQRFTLSNLTIDNVQLTQTPRKIRIRSNGLKIRVQKGDIIRIKASLMPPSLPNEFGSFPFCRMLWFQQIGGVGYAVSHPQIISKAPPNAFYLFFEKIRTKIAQRILSVMSEESAPVALSLIIGEQTAVPKKLYNNYRDAGIAHVLSVSGLHMMLISGIIFGFVRFFLTLFPAIALRINTKKFSAVIALIFGLFYLLISGMAVPAQRAYLMLCVLFCAVLLDRQALSVRNVCWMGFIILLIKPESLISASFQLSFSAVLALVSAFEALKKPIRFYLQRKRPFLIRWGLGITFCFLITNIVAGLATAPYALYHFYRYPTYGLLGNFMTSTLFAITIMPLLLSSLLLISVGLDFYPLKMADFCLRIVNDVTEWIASLPHASILFPATPTWGLLLTTVGGLWLCLWKRKMRHFGFVLILIGSFSFIFHKSPDIFIHQGGRLIAFQTKTHFFANTITKDKRIRMAWAERNHITTPLSKFEEKSFTLKGYKIVTDASLCDGADIAILNEKKVPQCSALIQLRYKELWRMGAHTIFLEEGGIRIQTSVDSLGRRLWSPIYK